MIDETGPNTASLQIPKVPSNLEKARMCLMQAAFNQASAVLQRQANLLGSITQIDDLSHRRSEGRVDVALFEDAEQRALAELESAALAFADAMDQARESKHG
jgi:hypothetical protein